MVANAGLLEARHECQRVCDAMSSHWRSQDPAQRDRPPRREPDADQHHGYDDPSEPVHAPVIDHTDASLQERGRMTEVEAIKARLAELPAGNEWARP